MSAEVSYRPAHRDDLAAIVALIADDGLGRGRERTGVAIDPAYLLAYDAMAADPNQLMAIAESSGVILGYMQITFIPGLSRQGAWRGQLESVRVAAPLRGRGIGTAFFDWAIAQCRARGCALVQLTTDKGRPDALRFYERLGFVASHHGMKLGL
jgi:GNAT superfamily N-acetyltransferase